MGCFSRFTVRLACRGMGYFRSGRIERGGHRIFRV